MLQNDMLTTINATNAEGHILRSALSVSKQWSDLQGCKRLDMRVLEIGTSTWSVTLPILQVPGGNGAKTPRFGSYCFTDVSPRYFEKAQDLFKPWQGRIDVKEDVLEQGFEAQLFDVVAASNVLHATKWMNATLAKYLKLLKPGGKLVVGDLTCSQVCVGLAFGTLPG